MKTPIETVMSKATQGKLSVDNDSHDGRETGFVRSETKMTGADKGVSVCRVSRVRGRTHQIMDAALIAHHWNHFPAMVKALEDSIDALERSYDVTEWPGEVSHQAITAKAARAALSSAKEVEVGNE